MKTRVAFLASYVAVSLCRAQDGAVLFKEKCVACHGANGAGKAALKGTNLLADEAKKRTDEQLADMIAKGPKAKASHAYENKGVTREQVNLLVKHVRELQKKTN